ncbi:hypothetical protein [Streptomyces sp. NPDC049906]
MRSICPWSARLHHLALTTTRPGIMPVAEQRGLVAMGSWLSGN